MTETSGNIRWHCSTLTPRWKLTVQFDGLLGKVILKFPGHFRFGVMQGLSLIRHLLQSTILFSFPSLLPLVKCTLNPVTMNRMRRPLG